MTLLEVDEFGQGQPIAWCLSNHETEPFMWHVDKAFERAKKQNLKFGN